MAAVPTLTTAEVRTPARTRGAARGNSTWTLTALADATYNAAAANRWDYWSAFVRLGYSMKMPEVLAP